MEGRVTTAEFDVAFVVNVYTPNAGAGLKRLGFRTLEWDRAFAAYVRDLEKIKPVVVVGEGDTFRFEESFVFIGPRVSVMYLLSLLSLR